MDRWISEALLSIPTSLSNGHNHHLRGESSALLFTVLIINRTVSTNESLNSYVPIDPIWRGPQDGMNSSNMSPTRKHSKPRRGETPWN